MSSAKYHTIVIDPPWPMQKIIRQVRPNQTKELDYPTMAINEIKQLPIPELASSEGCHVYLWTTHKYLPDAFKIFNHWHVDYECLLTWVKNVGFTPFSWMYSTEHVLFGRIGDLKVLKEGIRLDFKAKVTIHSKKPDLFYVRVRDVSPALRLEMFAREPHEGFDSWGNEVHNSFQATLKLEASSYG
jgi:N6-adenosine-specific RNA methylase IME4